MVHYPAGGSHQKMVHCGHKEMNMVSNNTLHQILTLHLNVAAEIETHHVFTIFYCLILVGLCELYPPCAVLI